MNRIILLSVDDAWIKRSGETAGASGSAGAVTLRMTFDSAWDGTSKTVYFTDSLGENSVKVLLGLDALVSDNTYDVPVPGEAMTQPGQATVTVVGESAGRVITTQAARFRVLDAAIPPSAGNSQPITPDEAAQLQAQIDALEEIFVTNRQQAQDAAQQAAESADQAVSAAASIGDAVQRAEAAAGSAQQAASVAQQAEEQAKTAGDAASTSAASASEDAAKAEQAAADALASKESASGSAQTAESASAQAVQSAQQAAQAASSASADASGAHDSAVSAQESAAVAQEGAQKADSAGKTAQSWAVGGTGTRPGEDTDNAKYWAEQAAQAAGGGVISFNGRTGAVMPQKDDYTAEDVGADPQGSAEAVKDELDTHVNNKNNPHNVTLEILHAQKNLSEVEEKAALADGDGVVVTDSAAGNSAKRVLWSTVMATLVKLFAPLTHKHAAGDVTSGTFDTARIPGLAASKITSGILSVARGGTGVSSLAALMTSLGAARVVTGSYSGTGKYGSANPTSLTFPVVPRLLIVWDSTNESSYKRGLQFGNFSRWSDSFIWTYGQVGTSVDVGWGYSTVEFTLTGNTLKWWCSDSDDVSGEQLNYAGHTYSYVMIG